MSPRREARTRERSALAKVISTSKSIASIYDALTEMRKILGEHSIEVERTHSVQRDLEDSLANFCAEWVEARKLLTQVNEENLQ